MAKADIIKTKRLLIEPFAKKYLSQIYISWLNNPKVVCFSEQRHKQHTKSTCLKYINSFKKTPNILWTIIVLKGKPGHIGNIAVLIDKFNQTADLSILMGEIKAWGKGYATEAWLNVCNYLFTKRNIRKITAGTLANNRNMLALMKRTRMKKDGRRYKQYLWNGKEIDVIYMAVYKKDWFFKNETNSNR